MHWKKTENYYIFFIVFNFLIFSFIVVAASVFLHALRPETFELEITMLWTIPYRYLIGPSIF